MGPGVVINGPSEGNRVTFTRPDTYLDGWRGPPGPAEAERIGAFTGSSAKVRITTG